MDYKARILEVGEYLDWDAFVAKHEQGNIHQISDWGAFQGARGEQWGGWIVAIFADDKMVGGAVVLRRALPGGWGWLYVPKGPLLDSRNGAPGVKEQMVVLLDALKPLAKKEKALFLRVESGCLRRGPVGFGEKPFVDWGGLGFRAAHAHYQPEDSLVLDLEGADEQILAQMKPKGRYNIKVAQKKGVKVLIAQGGVSENGDGEGTGDMEIGRMSLDEGVAAFHELLKETTSRDGFGGHPKAYYQEMLEWLGPDRAKLYLGQYEGKVVAGILVTFYGKLATYYFGASANSYRNVMAPYLLQWEAMREAKRRGASWYDLMGTAPLWEEEGELNYDAGHSWAGVTEFKLKFGGKAVAFEGGQELVLSPVLYWLMRGMKWLMGWIRKIVKR